MSLARIAVVLSPLMFATACASAGPPQPAAPRAEQGVLEDTPWSPHDLQPCVVSEPQVPPFGAVFDSAAVAARLQALPGVGTVLLSVVADSGKIRRLRVIEGSIEDPLRARVMEEVDAGLRRDPDGVRLVGRLRVELRAAEPPSLRTGLSQECEPVLFNRTAFGSFLQHAATQTEERGTVLIWVKVDEQGTVTDARIAGSSGKRELDMVTLSVARRMLFLPARMDRLPVAVWVQVPVTLR